jgi:putative nucleotidyltransferase with HDIG domain
MAREVDSPLVEIDPRRAFAQAAFPDLNTPGLSERTQRAAEAAARVLLETPEAGPTVFDLLSLDLETYNHSLRVALYAAELAQALELPDPAESRAIGRAALLHDIGAGQVPVEVLHRNPATLGAAERAALLRHTERGAEMLLEAGVHDPVCLDVCRNHHERCDGSGHPRGLVREEISTPSRIVAIADVFDALTSVGGRRIALSGLQALWRMKRHMEGQFDPGFLDSFIAAMVDPAIRGETDASGRGW